MGLHLQLIRSWKHFLEARPGDCGIIRIISSYQTARKSLPTLEKLTIVKLDHAAIAALPLQFSSIYLYYIFIAPAPEAPKPTSRFV
jgi:hypothetical protein